MSLDGKSAVVTGASRGIGRAIAMGLAAQGARVVMGYHTNHDLAQLVVDKIIADGGDAFAVGGDLAEEATVLTLFDQAEQRFGGVDIAIANAADALVKPFADYTEADFDGLFAANVRSVFFTLREAARRLGDGGRIVATSSGGTKMYFTETGLYLATKAAVEQFVRVL